MKKKEMKNHLEPMLFRAPESCFHYLWENLSNPYFRNSILCISLSIICMDRAFRLNANLGSIHLNFQNRKNIYEFYLQTMTAILLISIF